MVYKVKVLTENNFKLYYGTCEGEFKSRFYNHSKSFWDRGNETKFQSTFGNWRANPKIKTYVGKHFCMQRPINVAQDVAIYA